MNRLLLAIFVSVSLVSAAPVEAGRKDSKGMYFFEDSQVGSVTYNLHDKALSIIKSTGWGPERYDYCNVKMVGIPCDDERYERISFKLENGKSILVEDGLPLNIERISVNFYVETSDYSRNRVFEEGGFDKKADKSPRLKQSVFQKGVNSLQQKFSNDSTVNYIYKSIINGRKTAPTPKPPELYNFSDINNHYSINFRH